MLVARERTDGERKLLHDVRQARAMLAHMRVCLKQVERELEQVEPRGIYVLHEDPYLPLHVVRVKVVNVTPTHYTILPPIRLSRDALQGRGFVKVHGRVFATGAYVKGRLEEECKRWERQVTAAEMSARAAIRRAGGRA